MIITTHELYDFYYLITVIRNEIADKNNIIVKLIDTCHIDQKTFMRHDKMILL